ncbi:MAG: hypothetical protein K9G58_11535 [Bacteroidales bacterium]|nr:hypothetical protein [Bacteroidales bacterium]MCF8387880.1 hypothetical protein [Bacteroidales bacterium]MCF8398795.1 hypothetical protein [Bacteroidales bacterium]
MNKKVVVNALNSEFLDFEDALQNFSAIQAGNIEVIITRNIKDYRKGSISCMTPGDYLKVLNME